MVLTHFSVFCFTIVFSAWTIIATVFYSSGSLDTLFILSMALAMVTESSPSKEQHEFVTMTTITTIPTLQVLLGLQIYWASCLFSLYQQTRSSLTIRITTR